MDFDWAVKVIDLAIIVATLVSPFVAVQAMYNAYDPTGFADAEIRQRDLQIATRKVMKGNAALVVKPVPTAE
ncbi:hypothetical protein QTI24_01060 [Variovorax sp. J22P240]|uniref:hypothetical protein n=1 Tax=Variovorax sp. J22P240 TaxID=3053514 RepID=UPI0025785D3B|nr:hypothetical protein [Variovorax sp. J22P240]MDL9997170.1 hypothetical protein [Variovorax sp. J22P240]